MITSIPGLGGISGRFDRALSVLPSAPGQTAGFVTPTFTHDVTVAGEPTVRLVVTVEDRVRRRRCSPGCATSAPTARARCRRSSSSPLRLTGCSPGVPRTVTVRLPSFVRNILPGHRLQLTVSSTDFSYAGPLDARSYTDRAGRRHGAR